MPAGFDSDEVFAQLVVVREAMRPGRKRIRHEPAGRLRIPGFLFKQPEIPR